MPFPTRILIIRPSALGDVCRSVPVLVSLRRAFGDTVIDWVVQDSFVDAVRFHPALNEVIPFRRKGFSSWWWKPATTKELWTWSHDLRKRNYDLVVDCQGLFRSGLITAATGAAMRIGDRNARELAWLAYNERVECDPKAHAVERMLALLKPLDIEPVRDMRLYVSEIDSLWWAERMRELGIANGNYAVLAPTSRWASKRWPIERWRELMNPLRGMGIERCVVIGAPGEEEQVAPLVNGVNESAAQGCIDLAGKTSISQTMAVIAGSSVVIANDSAPLHMAVGFDVPCVALFGPTDPAVVGPYEREESVVQAQSARDALKSGKNYRSAGVDDSFMRAIGVEDVVKKLEFVLNKCLC